MRAATDVRRSGEEPQRGASPAALRALVNRVDNLLRDQASSALSVSLVILFTHYFPCIIAVDVCPSV